MSISELISKLATTNDQTAVAQLEASFAESVFGLLMTGVPLGKAGQTVAAAGTTLSFVHDPNGKRMIKACADPDLFNVNFPGCINVLMPGKGLLEMAEKMPNADGILLCSALSFHSFAIYQPVYSRFKRAES